MLKRYLQLAQKTAVLLLVLWTQQAPPAVADSDALEFRHGVSQIPNYKLKYPRGFTHFDYVNIEAPKGGALVLPTSVPLDSVSPLYKPMGYELSYDKLLERSGDEVSGYYCSLAESVAVSADGRRIVFRLHPEARWHDGTPITSTDIKFSIDTFRDDIMAAGWAAMLGWIIRVDAPDERTVVVHTESDAAKQVPFFVNMPMAPAYCPTPAAQKKAHPIEVRSSKKLRTPLESPEHLQLIVKCDADSSLIGYRAGNRCSNAVTFPLHITLYRDLIKQIGDPAGNRIGP